MSEKWGNRISERGPGLVLGQLLGSAGAARKAGDRSAGENLLDIDVFIQQARQAEQAKIHTIFLADTVATSETAPRPSLEPVTLLRDRKSVV